MMTATLIRRCGVPGLILVALWGAMAGCVAPPGPLVRAMERQGLAPAQISRLVLVSAPGELGPGQLRATYTQVGLLAYIRDKLNAARPCSPPNAEELTHLREIDLYDGIRTTFPVAQLRLAGDAVQPADQPDRWYRCEGMWDLTGIYLRTAALRAPVPPLATDAAE